MDRDPPSGRSHYDLDVTASDGKYKASTKVVVNLKDVNDNVPYFPQSIVKTVVPESTMEGTVSILVFFRII